MAIDFENTPLRWDSEGAEPSEELKKTGFQAGYKPPAQIFNYLFHNTSACLTELQNKTDELEDTKVNTADYTAESIIEKLNSATGATGGGLNADTLDGKDSGAFATSGHSHNEFENMVSTSGSEEESITAPIADADFLEGHPASYFTDASNITSGTLPIERGGTGATTASAALETLGVNAALANYQSFVVHTFSGNGEESRVLTLPITPRFILLYLKNQPPAKYDATNEYTLCNCGFAVNGGVSSIGLSLSGNKLNLTQSQSATNGVFVNLNKYLSQYSYIAFK